MRKVKPLISWSVYDGGWAIADSNKRLNSGLISARAVSDLKAPASIRHHVSPELPRLGKRGDMNRLIVLAAFVAGSSVAWAGWDTPSYSSLVSGSNIYTKYGAIAENSCTSDCNNTFTVSMPAVNAGQASITMNGFYIRFHDGSGYSVSKAKVLLSKTSYNTSTGVFTWKLQANLVGNPAPSNTTFDFGAWFTVTVADPGVATLTEKTINRFEGPGQTTCDSASACVAPDTISSVEANGNTFSHFALRGFEIHSNSGAGLDVTDLMVGVTGYSRNNSGQAAGSSYFAFTGASTGGTENVECSIGAVAIATNSYGNGGFDWQTVNGSYYGLTGSNSPSWSKNSSGGSTAAGSPLTSLARWQLTPSSISPVYELSWAAYSGTYSSSPSPSGSASGNLFSYLSEAASSPSMVYDAYYTANIDFFP